jgi:ubiquitin carboxyl-terminal hydrolase L3
MMLYECTPAQTQFINEESDHLDPSTVPKSLFYMKQCAQNACGTIALFHIIINAMKYLPHLVRPDSYLSTFFDKVQDSSTEDKSKVFEEFNEVKNEHKGASQQGQSAAQSDCDSHFISFIEFEGNLW